MQQSTNATAPQKAGRIFYVATVALLLMAIAITFIQKQRESAVAIAGATRGNVQQVVQEAKYWAILSLATVSLAILLWGIAIWRREKHRWAWVPVVVLLSLYVLLELMMV